MKPETGKPFSSRRFRLRNLVFVMRENQVFSAGVQVEALAQSQHRHDRALNVPSRAPRADLAFPRSLPWFRRLPQGKIAGVVFLVFVYVHAGAVFHACKIFFGELAISRKSRDAEIVRSVLRAIGKTLMY